VKFGLTLVSTIAESKIWSQQIAERLLRPNFGLVVAESKQKIDFNFRWSLVSVRILDSASVSAKD